MSEDAIILVELYQEVKRAYDFEPAMDYCLTALAKAWDDLDDFQYEEVGLASKSNFTKRLERRVYNSRN